jgi:hypothetical protein
VNLKSENVKILREKIGWHFRLDHLISTKNCFYKMGRSKVVKCAAGWMDGWMEKPY